MRVAIQRLSSFHRIKIYIWLGRSYLGTSDSEHERKSIGHNVSGIIVTKERLLRGN